MDTFTINDIRKVLRIDTSRPTLLRAEETGKIPKATRIQRGSVSVRKWKISDIPNVGMRFGKFTRPKNQKVISFFTGKGGVLKSTLSFNFGRVLALNGIKTLLIGLDIQESVTTLALGRSEYKDIDDISSMDMKGLYDFFKNNISIADAIKKTDIPTLDVLPETFGLNLLEKELQSKTKREYFFKKKLTPRLKEYDVIIFDNSPNWNLLIENSLVASNIVFAPVSCEIGTYQALDKNLNALLDFKEEMEIEWDDYVMIPTLLENNKISKQILGSYISKYGGQITNGTIRRTVKGQESMALKQSVFEYSPSSELANDYESLFVEMWERINRVLQ